MLMVIKIIVTGRISNYDKPDVVTWINESHDNRAQSSPIRLQEVVEITWSVNSPDNTMYVAFGSLFPNSDGSFEFSYDCCNELWKWNGSYLIEVVYKDIATTKSINYVGQKSTSEQISNIVINTDKSNYVDGDTVILTGKIPNHHDKATTQLSLIMTAPNGNLVYLGQPVVRSNGTFESSIYVGDNLLKSGGYGDYSITFDYQSDFNNKTLHATKTILYIK